jgi:hypothetical protein
MKEVRSIKKDGLIKQPDRPGNLKKSYVSPKLVEYGSIAKLTQFKGGTGADSKGRRSMS